ncbi:NADP oxidoreductase [Thiomicrorhabdus sediminis]|uniref:NADP oxidoreductase n=1 Tax=Thiomicrorhabdus sediminis TaxID=2580412 RepID=A0A4P9K7J1_9GAMM|nr:NADP oxidoreductase [Thiomicrorhabdus sediminis]QCU90881.1 NADP oxidoreductase [Thiomicrorhabdus sediminis]
MQVVVVDQKCLTPNSDLKTVYYLRLESADAATPLQYEPGDWLTVAVKNPTPLIKRLLARLNLDGDETIELRRAGRVSSQQALSEYLEITQLNPAILSKVQRQYSLGDWADRQAMIDFAYGKDILDLLDLFPNLAKQGIEFLQLLAPLAPRYYSIASACLADKGDTEIAILYRAVHYQTNGRERFGVASNYLAQLKAGDILEVEVKANPTFKLPEQSATPIMMIGAGTGLAPFIGFMQQRAWQQQQGENVGLSWLFFGEVSKQDHCLFCEQLEAWQQQGVLQASLAFSRDQKEKIYVQHRLLEQASSVWQLLEQGAHLYICGNQNVMAEEVKNALLQIIVEQGQKAPDEAQDYWQQLRKERRLQLDVY